MSAMNEKRRERARLMKAAHWVQRLEQGEAADSQLESWLEWCGESEANGRSFDEMQTLYRKLREAPKAYRDGLREAGTRRRVAAPAWALAAGILVAVLAASAGHLWRAQSAAEATHLYMTARGEHRTVDLSDGSRVVLGGDSKIDVAFSEAQRVLSVHRGEAYFKVRRDAARPFIVQAQRVRVTAVGTAFDVQRSSDRVAVTVTEGEVEVIDESRGERLRLTAGKRAVVHARVEAVPPPTVTAVDPKAAIAWQQGQLQFSGEPLSVVVDSVNRYAQSEVLIGDAFIGRMAYTGTVLKDHADEWIINLPHVFPLRALPLKDGKVVLVAEE
jgi:transmembrane sensor